MGLFFELCDLKEVFAFVKKHHYSHTHPGGVDYAFKATLDGELVGVCLIGHLAGNPKAGCVLTGYNNPKDYRELMRLVFYDDVPKNSESQFIGWCIRWMRKNTDVLALISFADPRYGHKGIIYRASNWVYTGLQKPDRPRLIINGKEMHPRQAVDTYGTSSVPQLRARGFEIKLLDREPKHRYIYILRDELSQLLKYGEKTWKTDSI
jgi:hypothetical protein